MKLLHTREPRRPSASRHPVPCHHPMTGIDAHRGDSGLRGCRRRAHHGCEMRGRYGLTADLGELAQRFEFDGDRLTLELAYNVAPNRHVPSLVHPLSTRTPIDKGEPVCRLTLHFLCGDLVGARQAALELCDAGQRRISDML